jgi:hypothetical protein
MKWADILLKPMLSLIAAMLGAYFIWLGTEVNSIGKHVERIDATVQQMQR